jgi:hypothetical protein
MKVWNVLQNTGEYAELECDGEKKRIEKPRMMSAKEFLVYFTPEGQANDSLVQTISTQ